MTKLVEPGEGASDVENDVEMSIP